MKKFTKLMLTFALLVAGVGGVKATKLYATYGTPAGNGSWDAENKTYSWTGSTNNLMTVFQFPNGELADYTSLHLNISTTGPRVCFMKGSSALATIVFGSAGEKNIDLSQHESTKNLDLSQVTHISFGGNTGSGSVVLTNLYLQKPMSLRWSDDGTAEIDITDLTASGGFTLNDQTGELTGTGASGELSINLPGGGVDLSSLTGFSVTYTGDNLFGGFKFGISESKTKDFYSNPTGRNDLATHNTVENVGDPSAIKLWKWWSNSTAGTMTISSIKLKANVITASNPHETLLTSIGYVGVAENNLGVVMGQGSTIYGKGSNIDGAAYVDLSSYDEMHFYGSASKSVRLLFNYEQSEPVKQDVFFNLDGNGYYSLDLTTLTAHKLNAIKFPWDGASGAINKVVLYKKSVPVDFDYVLSGAGSMTTSTSAALADALATSIDATGITAATSLPTANPNCLITANAGMVTNTSNVIVNGTCANLELTDGYPYKAPVTFTATNAKFTKKVSDAGYATMVIPFAAALPTGVEAYDLTAVNGETITSSSVDAITANEPVMIKADAATYDFKASNVSITATADGVVTNGLLNGGYATMTVAADAKNYVLQNNANGVNFYLVTGTDATVKPFRAYLMASGAGARALNLDLGETTGIETVKKADVTTAVYSLSGQRVAAPQKGLYIVNGKKVIVK